MNKSLLENHTDDSSEDTDIIYRNLNTSKQKYNMMEDYEKNYDLDVDNTNYKLDLCVQCRDNQVFNCKFYKSKFNNDYYLESLTNYKIPKNNKGVIFINIFRNNLNIYKNKLNYRTINNNKTDNEVFGDENIFIHLKTKKTHDYITIYKVVYKYKSFINKLYNKYHKN